MRSLTLILGFLFIGSSLIFAATTDHEKTRDVIVMKDVMVPMRDGVKLATDLYLPVENGRPSEQKLPIVLQRTPYNKEGDFYKTPATD